MKRKIGEPMSFILFASRYLNYYIFIWGLLITGIIAGTGLDNSPFAITANFYTYTHTVTIWDTLGFGVIFVLLISGNLYRFLEQRKSSVAPIDEEIKP